MYQITNMANASHGLIKTAKPLQSNASHVSLGTIAHLVSQPMAVDGVSILQIQLTENVNREILSNPSNALIL